MPRLCQDVSAVMSSISSFKLVFLWLSWSKVPQRGCTSEQKEGVFRHMSLLLSETKSKRLSNHLKMSRRRGNNDTLCWRRWHSIAKSKAESGMNMKDTGHWLCHFKSRCRLYKGSNPNTTVSQALGQKRHDKLVRGGKEQENNFLLVTDQEFERKSALSFHKGKLLESQW